MWSSNVLSGEDEESLLPPSPSPTAPVLSDAITVHSPRRPRPPHAVLKALYQLLLFTVPSFCRKSPGPIAPSEKIPRTVVTQKKHSTEYFHGVRGLASFIVFIFHWTHIHYPQVNSGYDARKNNSIWALPFIRTLYAGSAMVSVFFVVSGYVLTHRFVQNMHKHEFESLFSELTSLTFRRALRLFLPSLGSCLLAYTFACLNLISVPDKIDGAKFNHGLSELLKYIDLESSPWTWDTYKKGVYNPQLWSIAVEFRGSLIVFLLVLGLARTRMFIRLLVQILICVHAFAHKRWDMALFVAGMSVAELDVFVHMSNSRKMIMQKKCVKLMLWSMIFVGIFLAGFPRDNPLHSLGYTFAKNVWPSTGYRRRFWVSIASILIVAPMPYLPVLQSFFTTRLIQYLGKISFALYLIHGLGNRTIGKWLMHATGEIIGNKGYWTYALSYVVSSALYLPVIIWWSDMYWRAVDMPATRFAKWLEVKSQSSLTKFES